jgi:hypothetical protein
MQPLSGFLLDFNWDGTMLHGAPFYSHLNFIWAFALFPIGFFFSFLATYFINEPAKQLATD